MLQYQVTFLNISIKYQKNFGSSYTHEYIDKMFFFLVLNVSLEIDTYCK